MKPLKNNVSTQAHRLALWLAPLALLSLLAGPVFAEDFCQSGHDAYDDDEQVRVEAGHAVHWREKHGIVTADPNAWVRFKVLGFNDFHGQLSSGRRVNNRPVGGAAVLASYLKSAAASARNGAIVVHAGDHVGATPPVSALLQDEPSISFLNRLANDECDRDDLMNAKCNIVGTLGNHEFDEGVSEMMRLIKGGNHVKGPFLEKDYRGANFPYVNANVVDVNSGEPILPPYVVKRIRGMPVAFIGAVLKETPTIVTPSGVAGVAFLDEAAAINHYAQQLKHKGVRAIVVALHQGARQNVYDGVTQSNTHNISGAIVDIVKQLDDEIDIVVSGHAHSFTNTLLENNNGKKILVTQAFSSSTAFADIDVAIDPATRDIVEKSAIIVTTYADAGPGLAPDTEVSKLVGEAEAVVAPLVNQLVAYVANDITRTESQAGESSLGNLIADAQRAAMNTDFAFMNPGGIRADIAAGELTWGELFTVQPFGNDLVRMELSGAQIVQLLNQQWQGQAFARILKTSGLVYTWDNARPVGDRIVDVKKVNGDPLNLAINYSVTVNSFMATGGDNFTVLLQGKNRVVGPADLDALIAYVQSLAQPFNAQIEGRIVRIN